MKEILIIADGIVAKEFLERVCLDNTSDNNYKVIYYNDKVLMNKKVDNIKYFKFDPTSFSKLRTVLSENITEIFLIVKNKFDAEETYKNIRALNKDIHIILLDNWNIKSKDTNLSLLNAHDILSSRLFDFLPNVSVIAQNVGLGLGEIMEVNVPFNSPYIYRHVSNIRQKNWKITAIYRAHELILPNRSTMIMPNDTLLLIGNPNILKGVSIIIKQELGSFPSPYGKNIYILIDMLQSSNQEIENMVNSAFMLHSMINNQKLIIKVINPTYCQSFNKIKSYNKGSTRVFIDYETTNFKKAFLKDLEISNAGIVVTNGKMFKKYKKLFYGAKIPIFKIGQYDFSKIKTTVVLPEKEIDIEKLTATIFDLSAQLELDIELYNYDPNLAEANKELIQHFKNLAAVFNRKLTIIQSKQNPITVLKEKENILHFVPFSKNIKKINIFSLFSTSFQKLYYKLDNAYQIFIPIEENITDEQKQ